MWTFGIFDLLTESHQTYNNNLYRSANNYATTDINGISSVLVEHEKYDWYSERDVKYLSEINFGLNRYICMIDNSRYSFLNEKDMVERIISMQLNETLLDPDEDVEETEEYVL